MAKLLFTTDAFRPMGSALRDVPFLLDDKMRLVEPACSWLLHIAMVRGRTRSRETWRTYAEALYDWWQTLEAMDWRWDDVTPLHVAAYRDRMLSGPSSLTRRPYARSTINARLRTLTQFYRWCVQSGHLSESPFLEIDLRVRGPRRERVLSHLDRSGDVQRVNELTVRHTPGLPRPLNRAELQRIVTELSTRDRLIIEWGLTTGLRRLEVAELDLAAVVRCKSRDPMPSIRITRTKGDKPRVIYPPLPLVDRTRAYIREERAALVRRVQRANPTFTEPERLFVTSKAKKMSPYAVSAMFVRVAKRAGVTATFHALRHTYATTMLSFLQRRATRSPDLDPLLTLQVLLGHEAVSSTMVYLRVLATDLAEVERSVDDLYEALR